MMTWKPYLQSVRQRSVIMCSPQFDPGAETMARLDAERGAWIDRAADSRTRRPITLPGVGHCRGL